MCLCWMEMPGMSTGHQLFLHGYKIESQRSTQSELKQFIFKLKKKKYWSQLLNAGEYMGILVRVYIQILKELMVIAFNVIYP